MSRPKPGRAQALRSTDALGDARRPSIVGWVAGAVAFVVTVLAAAYWVPSAAVLLLGLGVLTFGCARSPRDATTVLTIFLAAQIILPATLVVPPLRSAGRPALLIGVAALILVLWGFLGSSSFQLARHVPAVWGGLAFFTASAVASYANALRRYPPPVEVRALHRWLLLVVALAGVALLTANGIDSRERLVVLLRRLVLLVCITAVIGILQFTTDIDLARRIHVPGLAEYYEFGTEQRSNFERVVGTTLHPIEFSVVLAMTLPFALHFAVFEPSVRRWSSYLQLALVAIAIPMALSRAGVVCLVLALVVLVWTWPSRMKVAAVLAGVGFLGAMRFAFPGLLGTIRALFVNVANDPSTTGRTQDYAQITGFVAQHRWLGRGGYTFLPQLYRTLDNQYLLTLIDSGIVGVIALLTLFAVALALARRVRRLTNDEVTRHLAQCVVATLVGVAFTFTTFDALSFPTMSALVFFLLGVAGALWGLGRVS